MANLDGILHSSTPKHSFTSFLQAPSSRGDGNGRQHVLSNLFQTLRPGGRKPPSESAPESSEGVVKDTLPRIEIGNRSQLTTPNQNSVPSYGAPIRGDGTVQPSCGANCIHHKRSDNSLRSSHNHLDIGDGLHHSSSNSLHGKDIHSRGPSPRRLSPSLAPSNATPRSGDGTNAKPLRSADQLK